MLFLAESLRCFRRLVDLGLEWVYDLLCIINTNHKSKKLRYQLVNLSSIFLESCFSQLIGLVTNTFNAIPVCKYQFKPLDE